MDDEILTERRGRILVVTLNRPRVKNAVDGALAQGLLDAVQELEATPELTVGVVTGAGGAFCAGMDLKAFVTGGVPREFGDFLTAGSTKPLIAAIEGVALAGGLEIALVCDFLVAAEGARLGVPEVKRGLLAAGGGLLRLPRRVPAGVALEMALTGDPITAEQAHAYGLVSRLTPTGEALAEALALAERIADNAPLAIAAAKKLVWESQGRTEEEFWELQRPLARAIFKSEDAKEGAKAFAEKRTPSWTGR